MPINLQALRNELIKRRNDQNKSLQQVGDACSVTRMAVSNWERGTYVPGYDKLNEWAKFLGADINIYLTNFESKPNATR